MTDPTLPSLPSLQKTFQDELLKKPMNTTRANKALLKLTASCLSSEISLDTLQLSWKDQPFPLLIYLLLNLEHNIEDLVDAESTMVLMNTFLSQGGSAHSLSNFGHSALQYAVGQNCEPATRLLIEQGADPYYVDPQGNTLLHIAVESEISLELKTYLCETLDLSDLSDSRDDCKTALHLALAMEDMEYAELMIQNGFLLDQPDYLHTSCQSFGEDRLVRALHLAGSPLNVKYKGISALREAATYQNQLALQFLIEHGYPTIFDAADLSEALEASKNSQLSPSGYLATQDYLNQCIMAVNEREAIAHLMSPAKDDVATPESPSSKTTISAHAASPSTPPSARRHLQFHRSSRAI